MNQLAVGACLQNNEARFDSVTGFQDSSCCGSTQVHTAALNGLVQLESDSNNVPSSGAGALATNPGDGGSIPSWDANHLVMLC